MAILTGSKGVAILFFTVVIALFAYFIYFLVTGGTDPAYYWHKRSPKAPVSQTLAAPPAKSLILIRNKAQTVGKLRIIYLGMADKHLRFDVNLLDLDPNFAYRYTIPLDQAKKRFRIADQYFKATTTSNGKIRLTQKPLR
jgi:hypothetical protein